MPSTQHLFMGRTWLDIEQSQLKAMRSEIDKIEGHKLLNTSINDICDYFVELLGVEIPVLDRESIVATQNEIQVNISQDHRRHVLDRSKPCFIAGTEVQITVPFSGDQVFFQVQPGIISLNPPRANISEGNLVICISGVDLKGAEVKVEIDKTLDRIDETLRRLRGSVQNFNGIIESTAREHVENRRKKLLADQDLVANLGFNLKERAGMPKTYTVPTIRRKIIPKLPIPSEVPFVPEPELAEADYEHILTVIYNMALVMEQSPSAFVDLNEEALRTHFLVQLNGQCQGNATGETFNYEGKTDILVRENGKNVFIGECKFWGGPKRMKETIDQLLGYSSWRDTKVAVIVFSRNKEFSKVLESIKKATLEHDNCKKLLTTRSETSSRFLFSHRDDPNRELLLTTLAFDVPT